MNFIHDKISADFGAFDQLTQAKGVERDWKALDALLKRPWFNRRWVIQEIALAPTATVHCGEQHVD